jgi:DNA (cytosine-5)-methyltransferase 1
VNDVDLFCGVGWDLAARDLGLDPLGIDVDADVCATREALGMRTLQGDVSALDPADFGPVRLVIGSPPCPTFSAAGRGGGRHLTDILVRCLGEIAAGSDTRAERREEAYEVLEPVYWKAEQKKARKKKREADRDASVASARRDATMSILVVEPLRWAVALRPQLIALEQVPDCFGLWVVVAQLLGALGYETWAGVLGAERYGVPQTRTRAILMASLAGPVQPPRATHQRFVSGEPARYEHTLDGVILPWISMAEALGWGMVERPCVTVAAGSGRQGGADALDGGSGSRAAIERERERERERELGSIGFRLARGAGMTERNGDRRPVPATEPAPVITSKARTADWVELDTHTHTHTHTSMFVRPERSCARSASQLPRCSVRASQKVSLSGETATSRTHASVLQPSPLPPSISATTSTR